MNVRRHSLHSQSKLNHNDSFFEIAEEIADLKLGFNSLCSELRSLKSQLLLMEEAVASIKSRIEFTQHLFELKIASLKTYVKIVNRIELQREFQRAG